jgi:hypothetical protein
MKNAVLIAITAFLVLTKCKNRRKLNRTYPCVRVRAPELPITLLSSLYLYKRKEKERRKREKKRKERKERNLREINRFQTRSLGDLEI